MNKKLFPLVIAFAALTLAAVGYVYYNVRVSSPVAETPSQTPVQSASEPEMVSTGALRVKWSAPVSIRPIDVFTDFYRGEGPEAWQDQKKNYLNIENYRKVGTVTDGPYAGASVVIVYVSPAGLGDASLYHFLVPKAGKPVLLERHSPSPDYVPNEYNPIRFDAAKFVIDTTAEAPELTLPTEISRDGVKLVMQKVSLFSQSDLQKDAPFFDSKLKTLAFTDPRVGKVYQDARGTERPQNGFYAVAPDGTVRAYALEIPFFDANLHVPQVTWNDGSKNVEEYWATDVGGCGAQNYVSVVNGVTLSELFQVGQTEQGDPIYRFKDPEHPVLKDIYETGYSLGRGDDKLSYGAFVAANPIFFWQDPFGRLVKFQKTFFLPAVECGKPVIYLYPEEATDISVKLDPQGGFTKSEPAYDGGWLVRATPNSELTNLKDGTTHPYLFWEGRGGLYETPKRGWVVAQSDVRSLLVEKLSALGMNEKERADFLEFWEPRMQDAPWYFVTFLGNQAMDALAPLEISPKPDTVIRILMDFMPLEKPIEVQGFAIRTPERKGFTVVEWGGVLR